MKKTIYLLVMLTALFLVGCADAGKDQVVTSGETVILDGSASKADFFGEIKKYQWKQVKHKHHKVPKVVLSDKHAVSPTFTAPIVSKKTTFVFHLVTMERGGYYSPWKTNDEVTVIVNPPSTENKVPHAVATVNSESVKYSESVIFDASDSNDTDGEIVSYEWQDANGTVLGSEVTFAHVFETVGTHAVTLTVTDNEGATSSTSLTVTVNALQKPIADINASATLIFINDTVTFDANGSRDSDGEIVSYTWKDVQGNVLSDMKQFTYTFTTSGEHNITLSVMDDDEQISTATITIIVQAELVSVSLTSEVSSLEVNATTQLHATAYYNDDTTEEVSSSVEWVVGDTTLISIDANGTLKALQSGSTSILAKVGEVESNSITIEIIPLDTTSPTLTLNGEVELTLIIGTAYSELGATATDDRDENITITQSGTVDVNSVGIYTITYTATDKAGNTSTLQRTVNVVDVTPPVLTLNGEGSITLEQFTTYIELGATALDAVDGNVSVIIEGSVDTATVATYTITYTARDSSGNEVNATREIVVVDVTAPVITLNGEVNITLEQNAPYVELGATALDAVDGIVSVSINGTVDTTTVGIYTITYTAQDSAGNEANSTRTVTVIDVTPPVITLNGEANITLEYGDAYEELGATATDNSDGNVSVTITENVESSTVGTYTIVYTARDSVGNEANLTRSITVIDVTPPVITLNGEANLTLEYGDAYEELGATAIDNSDGNVSVEIYGTVDTSLEGSYTVTYTATDSSGNITTVTRTVTIEKRIEPPHIVISDELNGTLSESTIPYNRITLEIPAASTQTLTAINITLSQEQNRTIRVKGVDNNGTFYLYNIPLIKGENQIELNASNEVGEEVIQSITINADANLSVPIGMRAAEYTGIQALQTTVEVGTALAVKEILFDVEGDGLIDETHTSDDSNFTVNLTQEGRYKPRVTIRTQNDLLYSSGSYALSLDVKADANQTDPVGAQAVDVAKSYVQAIIDNERETVERLFGYNQRMIGYVYGNPQAHQLLTEAYKNIRSWEQTYHDSGYVSVKILFEADGEVHGGGFEMVVINPQVNIGRMWMIRFFY